MSPPMGSTVSKLTPSSSNPFARAVQEFLDETIEAERKAEKKAARKSPFQLEVLSEASKLMHSDDSAQAFESANALQSYITTLETKQKNKSKSRWLAENLRPLISGLAQFVSTFDVLIQAGPTPACIIYSGARLVLQLAESVLKCLDTVVSIMKEIGCLLDAYKLYASAHSSSEKMQNLLVLAYKNIIRFWRDASRTLSKASTVRLFLGGVTKNLHAEWQNCQKVLHDDKGHINMLAQATVAQQYTEDRDEDLRRRIVTWLKGEEDESIFHVKEELQDRLKQKHQPGTCGWLYENDCFKDWKVSKTRKTIWYNAVPGSGKTILSSALANQLISEDLNVAYFFFSFNDRAKRRPFTAVRSLAHQLLKFLGKNKLPDDLLRLYKQELENNLFLLQDQQKAEKVVEILLNHMSRVYIIIDGLDECHDRLGLCRTLENIIGAKSNGLALWFLSSRQESDFRSLAQHVSAAEVIGSQELITKDIRVYLEERLSTTELAEFWSVAAQGNFLWTFWFAQVVTGIGMTCEADIEEELRTYPRNIFGWYLRSLEQLSARTRQEQELARRAFTILAVAQQPLNQKELLNVLAIRQGAVYHDPKRAPTGKLIEELCGRLVTFDRSCRGCEDNPVLRFPHKTIQDFFLQNPDTMEVPENVRKYFPGESSAHIDLGKTCLAFLNYERYQQCNDILTEIKDDSDGQHAFLNYAATFWFQHLIEGPPSNELFRNVMDFLSSPAFWTTLAVQSNAVPYLFAKYVETDFGSGTYKLDGAEGPGSKTSHDSTVNFALPLPHWLDSYGPSGQAVVKGFLEYIQEWQPVLVRYPEAVASCTPAILHGNDFPQPNPNRAEHMQVLQVKFRPEECEHGHIELRRSDDTEKLILVATMESHSVKEDGAPKEASENDDADNAGCRIRHWTADLILGKKKILRIRRPDSCQDSLSQPNQVCHGYLRVQDRESSFEHCILDLQNLNIHQGQSDKHTPGVPEFSKSSEEPWVVTSASSQSTSRGESLVYHVFQPRARNVPDSGYGSLASQSNSEEGSNADSDSASDVDSDDDSGQRQNFGKEKIDCNLHSLICLTLEAAPVWLPFQQNSPARHQICCAVHPKDNLIIWSQVAHELRTMDLATGIIKPRPLPEPINFEVDTAVAVVKEFRFSACGKILHYLLCAFSPATVGTTCIVQLTSFHFDLSGPSECMQQSCPPQSITYKFPESMTDISTPFVLTDWTPTTLCLALPPLYCRPKILRLELQREFRADDFSSSCFQTLQVPVYFPSSTLCRMPQIMLHQFDTAEGSSATEHFLLALDSEGASDAEDKEKAKAPRSPALIMAWRVNGGWMEWSKEKDECPKDLNGDLVTYSTLRGTFVDSEKRFNVPIRSGLDWTKKAFISCA